jgi:hypothetical protein
MSRAMTLPISESTDRLRRGVQAQFSKQCDEGDPKRSITLGHVLSCALGTALSSLRTTVNMAIANYGTSL